VKKAAFFSITRSGKRIEIKRILENSVGTGRGRTMQVE
jgi:hypothetical protein